MHSSSSRHELPAVLRPLLRDGGENLATWMHYPSLAEAWPVIDSEAKKQAVELALQRIEANTSGGWQDYIYEFLRVLGEAEAPEAAPVLAKKIQSTPYSQISEYLVSAAGSFPSIAGDVAPTLFSTYQKAAADKRQGVVSVGRSYAALSSLAILFPSLTEEQRREISEELLDRKKQLEDWEVSVISNISELYRSRRFTLRVRQAIMAEAIPFDIPCKHLPQRSVLSLVDEALRGGFKVVWKNVLSGLAERDDVFLTQAQMAQLCASADAETRSAAVQYAHKLLRAPKESPRKRELAAPSAHEEREVSRIRR